MVERGLMEEELNSLFLFESRERELLFLLFLSLLSGVKDGEEESKEVGEDIDAQNCFGI
jgi:hypothetical protein